MTNKLYSRLHITPFCGIYQGCYITHMLYGRLPYHTILWYLPDLATRLDDKLDRVQLSREDIHFISKTEIPSRVAIVDLDKAFKLALPHALGRAFEEQ